MKSRWRTCNKKGVIKAIFLHFETILALVGWWHATKVIWTTGVKTQQNEAGQWGMPFNTSTKAAVNPRLVWSTYQGPDYLGLYRIKNGKTIRGLSRRCIATHSHLWPQLHRAWYGTSVKPGFGLSQTCFAAATAPSTKPSLASTRKSVVGVSTM